MIQNNSAVNSCSKIMFTNDWIYDEGDTTINGALFQRGQTVQLAPGEIVQTLYLKDAGESSLHIVTESGFNVPYTKVSNVSRAVPTYAYVCFVVPNENISME